MIRIFILTFVWLSFSSQQKAELTINSAYCLDFIRFYGLNQFTGSVNFRNLVSVQKYLNNSSNYIDLTCMRDLEKLTFTDPKIATFSTENSKRLIIQLKDSSNLTFDLFDFDDITFLLVKSIEIRSLSSQMISRFKNLQQLQIQSIDLRFIQNGTFNGINQIRNLILTGNNFEMKSLMLENYVMDKLENLELATNQITYLDRESFSSNLKNLVDLSLDGNLIESLEPRVFRHSAVLRSLNLERNRISFIHDLAFDGLFKLKTRQLAYNQIKY